MWKTKIGRHVSGRTWLAADHHIGHSNILKFTDESGALIRGSVFKTIEEHDETIIANHNALVDAGDRVYLLGDFCIHRRFLHTLDRLNGRLVLVKGNHDIFKAEEYLQYVDDLRSCVVQKDKDGNKVILSHIPIHPDSLGRFGTNIHGHLHHNQVKTIQRFVDSPEFERELIDTRYICVSLEHTNYRPVQIHEALAWKNS